MTNIEIRDVVITTLVTVYVVVFVIWLFSRAMPRDEGDD